MKIRIKCRAACVAKSLMDGLAAVCGTGGGFMQTGDVVVVNLKNPNHGHWIYSIAQAVGKSYADLNGGRWNQYVTKIHQI